MRDHRCGVHTQGVALPLKGFALIRVRRRDTRGEACEIGLPSS
jgi:hypothetical protein